MITPAQLAADEDIGTGRDDLPALAREWLGAGISTAEVEWLASLSPEVADQLPRSAFWPVLRSLGVPVFRVTSSEGFWDHNVPMLDEAAGDALSCRRWFASSRRRRFRRRWLEVLPQPRATYSATVPKQIKGNPRRKPPDPAASHRDIDEWFEQVMPGVRPIVRVVDEAIRDAIAGLEYAVKFARAFYGLPDLGWIVEVAAYHRSVNILFLGGVDFDRPPPLGDVGRTRYVKITCAEELTRPEVLDWLAQAGRTPGWG